MHRSLIRIALIAGLGALAGTASAAGVLQKIEPSAASVALEGGKAAVRFTISGEASDTDTCGYWVDYGDGSNPDTRVLSQKDGLFPRTHEHVFTKPGGFSVRVRGQRVRTTLGCVGEATTFVTVTDSTPAKPAAAKAAPAKPSEAASPACPAGWELVKGSHNAKTGAYTCAARAPETKLDCPQGTRYFAEAGRIGCRR